MLPADAPEVDGMCCPQGQGSNVSYHEALCVRVQEAGRALVSV
jgi:hypothetical protein